MGTLFGCSVLILAAWFVQNVHLAVGLLAVGALFEWTANWNLVLLLFAGVYFVGALCWVFVDSGRKP